MKPYGKIYHLPGSLMTEGDVACSVVEAHLATREALIEKIGWLVTVMEKSDGRNVGVERRGGQ